MTFAINVGKYGGFYFRHDYTTRLCLGWIALTFYPFDMDDLHARHLDALKTMAGMMDDQSRELARLRVELDAALNATAPPCLCCAAGGCGQPACACGGKNNGE